MIVSPASSFTNPDSFVTKVCISSVCSALGMLMSLGTYSLAVGFIYRPDRVTAEFPGVSLNSSGTALGSKVLHKSEVMTIRDQFHTKNDIKQTNHFIKINNHIAIDLVGAELHSIISLDLRSTFLSQFDILTRTVFQMDSLLISKLSYKLCRVASPQLVLISHSHIHLSRRNLLSFLNNRTSTNH